MRWTREDCCPVHFTIRTVVCETQALKKHAKWRQHAATKKLLRRVCCSPHIPSRSAPEAAGEPVEPEAAVRAEAAVGLVAELEAQVARAEQVAAEGRAEPEALAEPEAVAERAAQVGLAGGRVVERAIPAGQGQRLSTIRTIR
jgi:hypothetical protein